MDYLTVLQEVLPCIAFGFGIGFIPIILGLGINAFIKLLKKV